MRTITMRIFVALVFACALAAMPRTGFAENQHYLSIESKEVLYNPADQVAASFLKSIVTGKNFRLVSDKLVVDFKGNTLRAAGDVYLYTARPTESVYPQFGEPSAIYDWEYFSGREIVLNFEYREAVVYPTGGGAPVTVDLNFARIVPALKHTADAPEFTEFPKTGVFACFALSYYSNGRFALSDATYFEEGGRQYYTALLLADGPDLGKMLVTSKQLYARKSNISDRNFQPVMEQEAYSDTTIWLRNHPRYNTLLDVDGVYSDERGFQYFTPALLQTISFGNFAGSGRVENNETGMDATAAVSTFTPSRNRYQVVMSREHFDYADELTLEQSVGSRRNVYFNSTFWDDDFRTMISWYDSIHTNDFNYADTGPYYNYDNKYMTTELSFYHDPARIGLGPYSMDFTGSLSRGSSNSRNIITTDTYADYYNRSVNFSANPRLIAGPVPAFWKFRFAQTVSFYYRYLDSRRNMTGISGGALSTATSTSEKDTYYELDAATRLFMPVGNSFTFEVAHKYEQKYGDATSVITPGLAHSWNLRDYVFAGAAYDFDSKDWETVSADLVVRGGESARFFYSYRYDLVMDDIEKSAAGLILDIADFTIAVSYEDIESELRIAVFPESFGYAADKNLIDSIP